MGVELDLEPGDPLGIRECGGRVGRWSQLTKVVGEGQVASGDGADGEANYLTTDLSYDYVRINAEYRT